MMSRLALLLGTLLLGGCSLHQPTAVNLPDQLPDQFIEQQSVPPAGLPLETWWLAFNDERLNALMEELFDQNLQLEQGFARLDQALASAQVVRSARFPAVNIDGTQGRSREPGFAGDNTGNNQRLAAAASFELDLWGKLAARSEAAGKLAEASRDDLQVLYLSLSAQLADLYYFAVEQRSQIALVDVTIASFTETVERVESRYQLGLVPSLDVYQARQNLAAAHASRYLFEANLASAEHAIAVLIGRYPDRESAGELAELPELVSAFPAGLPSSLIARRPDLQAALRRVEAVDAQVAAAIADRFPAINLFASAGHTRQDFAAGLLKGDFWSLLGSFTAPVFDAGRRKSEVERTRAVVREAVAGYQQQVLNAFREVEDALANNQATESRVARLVETEAATSASLRLSLDRYLYGLTDYLPVLTAQRSQFETQSRLLSVRRQLLSDRISLGRALGGDWMNATIEQRLATSEDKKS